MLGIKDFRPWVGRDYQRARLKLLVLGESRYDRRFTDHRIIKDLVIDGSNGVRLRTLRKFERAVLGKSDSEVNVRRLWGRTLFYNYNTHFFPGGPRVKLPYRRREHPENSSTLRRVLQHYRPTHVIAWGMINWDSIDANCRWKDHRIPRTRGGVLV
jgi:hypothetical protein